MKSFKYILLFILPLFALYSCKDDDGTDPAFGDKDVPMIYITWAENTSFKVGETVKFAPQVSPSDGATYKWTLDGEVLTTNKDLEYKIPDYMVKELRFEVERNGVTNFRTTSLLAPQPFVPKSASKKSIGYLTKNGQISDIDWSSITHLIYSSAIVTVDEKDNTKRIVSLKDGVNTGALIAYAHHYGVFVSLDVSGVLASYLNAAPVYGSYTFYDWAVSSDQSNLIKEILAKAEDFDGINIYMDKANTANGTFGDPAKLKTFYENMATTTPAKKNIEGTEYDYLLSMSVVGGWTRGSLAGVVNIPRYNWVNILAFGAENLVPGAHSAQWFAEQEVGVWLGWQGPIAPSRVVLVVPAFGLRYFGKQADMTAGGWGELWKFTEYLSYRDICNKHTDAPSKNTVVIKDEGTGDNRVFDIIYYDGLADIQAKADYAKSKNLAGMGLWSIESDSKESAKSLMKKINTSLGN